MILVLIFIVAVIMYRVLISIPLFQNPNTRALATTIASGSSAVVNLILIMALGKVYEKLALKLTQWGELVQMAAITIQSLARNCHVNFLFMFGGCDFNKNDYF